MKEAVIVKTTLEKRVAELQGKSERLVIVEQDFKSLKEKEVI